MVSKCSRNSIKGKLSHICNNISHENDLRSDLKKDASIFTVELELFAKTARFKEMLDKWHSVRKDPTQAHLLSVYVWTVVIDALGKHGKAKEALDAFQEMISFGFNPDSLTFLVVMNACSHCGLVSEVRRLLSLMPQFNVDESVKHRTCLVDALARAGDFDGAFLEAEAENKPYVPMFMSILSHCREKKTRDDIAKQCFEKLKFIDPKNDDGSLAAAYVVYGQILKRAGGLQ